MGWHEWEKKEDGISEYDDSPFKARETSEIQSLRVTGSPPHPSFLFSHHLYQGKLGEAQASMRILLHFVDSQALATYKRVELGAAFKRCPL